MATADGRAVVVPVQGDRRDPEVLSRDECLRLMSEVPIGRVAVIVGEVPVVVPVNFSLPGEDIVFRTAPGTKLVAAVSRSAVSFEVDAVKRRARDGACS